MCGLKPCTSIEAFEAKETKQWRRIFLKRTVTIEVVSPKQKRCVNDTLTERIRRLSVSLNLAKKRHEKDRTTKPWRITQRGAKERRGARSSSTVELLAGRMMEARRRTLARILAVRRCSEERANTLERIIVGPHCYGSERAVAGTQGRRADCCVEHAGRTSEDSCVPSGGALRPQREGDWIQKHTRRKSMASFPISEHFFVSLFAVVRAAC